MQGLYKPGVFNISLLTFPYWTADQDLLFAANIKGGTMEIDMHYGAIYYLASLAGIDFEEARKIAWSSQFVDDANYGGSVQFEGGEGYICTNSAHRHLSDNLSAQARLVWVPFHFVPDPNTQAPFLRRLECVKDSELVNASVVEALNETDPQIRPYRFGVALHAYADSWSHYGFSGIPSDTNLVRNVKTLNIDQSLWEKSMAWVATHALNKGRMNPIGHLYAASCPDLPYLEWEYTDHKTGSPVRVRNNHEDFSNAVNKIYTYMLKYKGEPYDSSIPAENVSRIDQLINLQQDSGEKRLEQWAESYYKTFGLRMPSYKHKAWITDAFSEAWEDDVCLTISGESHNSFRQKDFWKFSEGLKKHLTFIVTELSNRGLTLM